jgi:hypothetical protein
MSYNERTTLGAFPIPFWNRSNSVPLLVMSFVHCFYLQLNAH